MHKTTNMWSFCEQTKPNETKAWLRGLLSREARKWGLHRATFDWLELFKYLCTGDRACSKTEIRLSKHQRLSCRWSNLSVTNARQKCKMLMTQKTMSARFSSVVPFAHKWTQFKMSVTREGCSTCQVPVILHLWEHFSYKLHCTVKHTMEKKTHKQCSCHKILCCSSQLQSSINHVRLMRMFDILQTNIEV